MPTSPTNLLLLPRLPQARNAIERGARALVVNVDGLDAAQHEVFTRNFSRALLERPLVVLLPEQAEELHHMINVYKDLDVEIEMPPVRDYFDLGIFLTCFLLICLVCLAIVVKMRWRRNNKQVVKKLMTA
ncbi:E3 ubiquitin-protein ligase ZNRF3-like [Penaeus monodon]|uniref:E3 ubiquitin-protein ligase ZNRF3-like n=1 Tax=Penaeus monodon TaxID=6687 RepID=UPI0018A74DAD|nr:E3 ubiquitin-protein ligase ZNRF3-like [Penaeus monodon]